MPSSTIELKTALENFTRLLAESPQYRRFVDARAEIELDPAAEEALSQHQFMQRLGLDLAEGLFEEAENVQNHPLVEEYVQAEKEFRDLCQVLNEAISQELGLDYAANCAPGGCC